MIIWIINRVLLLFSLYKLAERTFIFKFAFLFPFFMIMKKIQYKKRGIFFNPLLVKLLRAPIIQTHFSEKNNKC